MGSDPVEGLVKGHRPSDAKALHVIAAQLRQQRVFAHGFDAFGQRFQSQPFGHGQDRAQQPVLIGIAVGLGHKGPVDLDARYREAADRRDRGVAGAEIVQIDTAAQFRQPGDIAGNDVVAVGHDRFQHLDREPVRGQVEPVQFPANPVQQSGVAQFGGGEVDADLRHVDTGAIPRLERGKGVVEDDLPQAIQQSGLFHFGQEPVR